MTKAIPGAGGMDWKKFSSARRPPGRRANADYRKRRGMVFGINRQFRGSISRETHEAYSKLIQARRFRNAANNH